MTTATGVEKGGTIARTCLFLQQPLATLQLSRYWLVMMTLLMIHNLVTVVVVRTQLWQAG